MRTAKATSLTLLMLALCTQPLLSAEPDYHVVIERFIKTVKSNDRVAIANLVVYPLHRKVPLPSIDTPTQFLERFDEVFDEQLLKTISSSSVSDDWAEVGWRGIMFNSGMLWLDTNGKISAINYQTEKAKSERARLTESNKHNLHSSLQKLLEPVMEWKTKDYRIRIDRTSENRFRYAVWPAQKASSEKPDLILNNGVLHFDGSGGNHYYDFKSGVYLYRCYVFVMGAAGSPEVDLTVYKNDEEIMNQPAIEVIMGR